MGVQRYDFFSIKQISSKKLFYNFINGNFGVQHKFESKNQGKFPTGNRIHRGIYFLWIFMP
jgi:hypothetical protein